MCSNGVGPKSPILCSKFKYHFGSGKEYFERDLTICGHGGKLDHVTRSNCIILARPFTVCIWLVTLEYCHTYKMLNYLFHFFTEKPKQKSTAGKKRELPPPPVGQYFDV